MYTRAIVTTTFLAGLVLWGARYALDALDPGDPLSPGDDARWAAIWSLCFLVWALVGVRVICRRRWGMSEAKRLMDIGIAATALILFAPVMAVVALLIRVNLGRGVLFAQMRPGLHGRPFRLLKFRTMTASRDSRGRLLDDGQRLTRLGRVLRALSLDELPQLLNVLRGDMSIVGPRPLLMHYLPHYTPDQARRHEVRPGITGLAQVNGRNAISWERKFELDVQYVDTCTLMLDLKIMALTALRVLQRGGVNAPGSATAEPFAPPPE